MGDAILTAFPVWDFYFFCKVTCFNACLNFLANRERHATLAALVCFCLWYCILASRNHVYSQRNKCFQGMLYPCGYTSGALSNMPTGTQQQFQPFWQCCACCLQLMSRPAPPTRTLRTPRLCCLARKKMAQGCLGHKKRQDVSSYEFRWDERTLYIEGATPNCQWRKNVKSTWNVK